MATLTSVGPYLPVDKDTSNGIEPTGKKDPIYEAVFNSESKGKTTPLGTAKLDPSCGIDTLDEPVIDTLVRHN